MGSGIGVGAGAALYEAMRRRPGQYGGQGLDDNADSASYRPSEPVEPQPMGTIQTMARALPQSPQIGTSASSQPGFDPAATPVERPRRVLSVAGALPDLSAPAARPQPVGGAALEIKRAAGDYASAPTPDAIKSAAGQPAGSRPVLSTRRATRPPLTTTVDGATPSFATPSGVGLNPPVESAGRAPLPPLRADSPAYGNYQDEAAALPSERQYIEQHRPHGVLGRIGSALKMGGRFLATSGLNPLYAAEGLAIGLLDKDANAREMYRDYVEPRSVDRQRRHLSMAGAEMGIQNTRADNARADDQLQMSGEQHAAALDIQRATLQDRERQWTERLQEKTLNDWMLRNAGRPIPRSIAASSGHPELEGYVPPQKVANGPQPHFQYNQATGETAVVESDGNGSWKITRPQGEAMQPTPERPTREPLEDYKATVGPEAYGAKSWNDLIDNPAYGPAYQQALESAKAMTSPGQDPGKMLQTLIGGGRIKLPPRQITVYEYARQNPHPLQDAAAKKRAGDRRDRRLSPRSSSTTPIAPAQGNKTLTADQVQKFVDATPPNAQGRKPTIDEAKSHLRSKGYIVP